VIDRRVGVDRGRDLKHFIIEAAIEIVPVTLAHAEVAREAYQRYGRGKHAARLNFSDCLAYALARIANEPLLFKGADFRNTDIAAVV
jgi:ribonuclease VapC